MSPSPVGPSQETMTWLAALVTTCLPSSDLWLSASVAVSHRTASHAASQSAAISAEATESCSSIRWSIQSVIVRPRGRTAVPRGLSAAPAAAAAASGRRGSYRSNRIPAVPQARPSPCQYTDPRQPRLANQQRSSVKYYFCASNKQRSAIKHERRTVKNMTSARTLVDVWFLTAATSTSTSMHLNSSTMKFYLYIWFCRKQGVYICIHSIQLLSRQYLFYCNKTEWEHRNKNGG